MHTNLVIVFTKAKGEKQKRWCFGAALVVVFAGRSRRSSRRWGRGSHHHSFLPLSLPHASSYTRPHPHSRFLPHSLPPLPQAYSLGTWPQLISPPSPLLPPIWQMGSLKRKNASLGASSASSKRPTREDMSGGGAVANGYASGRAGAAQNSVPSPSSAASIAAATPSLEPLCNGVSTSAKASQDLPPPTSVLDTKSGPLILVNESARPNDLHEQEVDTVVVLPESSHSSNLGPLTPNHAGWFSWNSIHAVEKRELPEFFNSKSKLKTPAFYMEYRNLLMRKYLENPDKVFTLADAVIDQKGGHLEAVKRIFEFLNHWGLLNSRALQHAEAEKPSKSKASVVEDTSAQPQWPLTSSLYRFGNPVAFHPSRSCGVSNSVAPTAVMTETTAADLQGGEQGMAVEYHCNSCSADCSKKRFHCQKQADFDLCPECYNEGKFSVGITSTDFILMEALADANSSGGWSDQETLLLLEALEMFGDNFSEISEHVGTKTKAQCILHFIRLPIEDPFLETSEQNNTKYAQATGDSIGIVKTAILSCEGDKTDENPKGELYDQAQQEDSISISGNAPCADLPVDDEKSSSAIDAIMAAAEAAGLFVSDKHLALSECGNPVMTLVAFLAALVTPDAVGVSAEAALKVLADHASALQLADLNSFHLELEASSADASSASAITRESEDASSLRLKLDKQEMPDVDGDGSACNDKGSVKHDPEDLTKGSSLVRVKNAATTALAAAAVKAKFLADQEEWEILRLAAFVVDSQTKKIETKLKLFRELDAALEKEHILLERSRQRLLTERSQIVATRAVQSSASGHYTNMNVPPMAGNPRPHFMPRLAAGFISVPPVPTGPPRAPGPYNLMRGPGPIPPQGTNMAPMRPAYYNNTQF